MRSILLLLSLIGGHAGDLVEDFSTSPFSRGWKTFGVADFFSWNSNAGAMDITWDSSKTNSYFYFPLPQYITRSDSFSFELKLTLHDIAYGTTPGKPYTFQLAFGFLNTTNAFAPDFFRGSGVNTLHGARNLVEFAYFPDSGFGATVAPTIATGKNQIYFSDNHPLQMTTEDEFHIHVRFDAVSQTLLTTIRRNGEPFGMPPNNSIAPLVFPPSAGDVVLNTFAICSYSDEGQTPPQFSGSILAHGTIDDLRVKWPDPPRPLLAVAESAGEITISLEAEQGWTYVLEGSTDLGTWDFIAQHVASTSEPMEFKETAISWNKFYRVALGRTILQ